MSLPIHTTLLPIHWPNQSHSVCKVFPSLRLLYSQRHSFCIFILCVHSEQQCDWNGPCILCDEELSISSLFPECLRWFAQTLTTCEVCACACMKVNTEQVSTVSTHTTGTSWSHRKMFIVVGIYRCSITFEFAISGREWGSLLTIKSDRPKSLAHFSHCIYERSTVDIRRFAGKCEKTIPTKLVLSTIKNALTTRDQFEQQHKKM